MLMLGDAFSPAHFLVLGVCFLFVILPFWQIYKKAGFSPLLAFLMVVPGVNVVLLYILAFSRWPVSSGNSL
jgi:hypothetical protein